MTPVEGKCYLGTLACFLPSFSLPFFLSCPLSLSSPHSCFLFLIRFPKAYRSSFLPFGLSEQQDFQSSPKGSSPTEELDKEARRRPAVTPRAPRPEDEPACWFPCFHPTLWMNASIMPTSPALPTRSPNSGVAHLPWKLCTPLPGGVETLEQLYELPSSG